MNSSGAGISSERVWGVVIVWLLAILAAGYFGVFHSMSVPLPLGVAAILPVLVFWIWYRASSAFRAYVLSRNAVVLTAVQSWRVGGFVFLILMAKGLLPAGFAYSAGLGDMAIGVTAPFVAWAVARKKISTGLLIAWQVAGMADLVAAVTLGALYSDNRISFVAHGATTGMMGFLPMSLVPTFIVPLLAILHLMVIARVREAEQAARVSSGWDYRSAV
jgi:hypothetical protein